MTPRRSRVTSVDVARHAGVSQSAVSRALSPGKAAVSVALRLRVLASAKALGYRPNAHARSLSSGRSRIVALLFSYLDNPFYALALEKLCLGLQAEGHHALVFLEPDTTSGVEREVADLLDYRVDGIITASVELGSTITDECRAYGIPVVMFNRLREDPDLSSVTTDNVTGGRLAAAHLLDIGRRNIAILAGWEGASTNRDREWGFAAELAARGQSVFARAVGHFDPVRAAAATRDLFDCQPAERPDALFAVNDYMAFPAMSVLRHELGIRVPDDVAVVGFDDVPLASAPEYTLTSVRQPLGQMVEHAIRFILRRMNDPAPERVALAPLLVVRGSTSMKPDRWRRQTTLARRR
ncbi:MAG: LacI family DNA-binding transcriptional regulator [Paracoccaceae bacterium]